MAWKVAEDVEIVHGIPIIRYDVKMVTHAGRLRQHRRYGRDVALPSVHTVVVAPLRWRSLASALPVSQPLRQMRRASAGGRFRPTKESIAVDSPRSA